MRFFVPGNRVGSLGVDTALLEFWRGLTHTHYLVETVVLEERV